MAFSLVKDCYILRISYVYVTYILRIWYVIDSGKKGKHKEKARKWQGEGKENAKNKESKRREKRAKK